MHENQSRLQRTHPGGGRFQATLQPFAALRRARGNVLRCNCVHFGPHERTIDGVEAQQPDTLCSCLLHFQIATEQGACEVGTPMAAEIHDEERHVAQHIDPAQRPSIESMYWKGVSRSPSRTIFAACRSP